MKKVLIIVALLVGSHVLFGADSFPCNDSKYLNSAASLTDQMTEYLVNNIWSSKTNALAGSSERSLYFNSNGQVNLLIHHNNELTSYQFGNWEARQDESGGPYFHLIFNNDTNIREFQVFVKCKEIELVNTNNGATQKLSYEKQVNELNNLRNSIVGSWQNSIHDVSGNIHFLSYSLNDNGEYVSKTQTRSSCTEQYGTWSLSKDGQYLFFYPQDGTPNFVIGIDYLEGDEMVLSIGNVDSGKVIADFESQYFNKI